jgi:hypothetical protein
MLLDFVKYNILINIASFLAMTIGLFTVSYGALLRHCKERSNLNFIQRTYMHSLQIITMLPENAGEFFSLAVYPSPEHR